MQTLQLIHEALTRMGLQPVTIAEGLEASSPLVTFKAQLLTDALRLEVQIVSGVVRNKLALWNVVHHNNTFIPFGQFYISPQGAICLGLLLPLTVEELQPWAVGMAYELFVTAESYHRLIHADYAEAPFEGIPVSTGFTQPDKGNYTAPTPATKLSEASAAALLERVLQEVVGTRDFIHVAAQEYAITAGEAVVTVSIQSTPYLRRMPTQPEWFIGLHTEVGVLDATDDKLWIRLNTLNYSSCLVAYTVRYLDRKPLIFLNSALPADSLQHPNIFQWVIARHQQATEELLAELDKGYQLQSMLNYRLGMP